MPTQSVLLRRTVVALEFVRVLKVHPWTVAIRCDDGRLYHVRFEADGQQAKKSAYAWISAVVAQNLALSVTLPQPVAFPQQLLHDVLGRVSDASYRISLEMEGFYLGDPLIGTESGHLRPFSLLPRTYVRDLDNREDFLGMYLFDVWAERQTTRRVVFNRTGRDRKIRATFCSDGELFSSVASDLMPSRGSLCNQTVSVYDGLWNTRSLSKWLNLFERVIPRSLDSAIASLPPAWTTNEDEILRAHLLKRLGSLHKLTWTTALPDFYSGASCKPARASAC